MTHELTVTVASRRGGHTWWDVRCTCGWHGRQTTIVQRAAEEHDKHVRHEEERHAE
jgi:hypothetical protein